MSRRMTLDPVTDTIAWVNHCDVCNIPESLRDLIADEWTGNHICTVCATSKFYLKGFEEE